TCGRGAGATRVPPWATAASDTPPASTTSASSLGPRIAALLGAGAGGVLGQRDPLRAVAAIGVAEGREGLLVEPRAGRDLADAVVVVLVVPGGVSGPRGQRDLVPEPRDRRPEHPQRALVVERLQLVDRRGGHLRAPPDDHAAVLLVVHHLARVDRVPVEAPDRPERVVAPGRRR